MDEIPELSVRRFREFGAQQKEELYETLLTLSEAVKDIPKNSLRKTLDLTFAVLRYKGEQVNILNQELNEKGQHKRQEEEQNERLLNENDRVKQMLEKLEDENNELKQKIKNLNDELVQQQKRLQDALNTAEVSDKDSSDPLSELDKQEELLRNISRKNKHIKRLLKEIESLQSQNIEQSKTIIQLEKDLQHERSHIIELEAVIQTIDDERKSLKCTINELNTEVARLEGNITYLEEERENSERDLKDFIEKLEVKAQAWKSLLDDKEDELKKLRCRLANVGDNVKSGEKQQKNKQDLDQDAIKLMHSLEIRDQQIEKLESKLKTMAEEMISTTKLMNKFSKEREVERNPKNPRACCKLLEQSLQAANKRCREISELLERSEEDNALKSKQALQAISALEAYQRGEDGLPKAIRKCSTLEQKIISRDKQIRDLIMQLNSMHEIANENTILRKRLNIPDDVVISTKNLAAKERSKEKIIDRLTLKLRASEEMRLQLKLEKNELSKQISDLHKKLQQQTQRDTFDDNIERNGISIELGEIMDNFQEANVKSAAENEQNHPCTQCNCHQKGFILEHAYNTPKPLLAELQAKYQEVLEENESLRHGMHEILEKLREYDANSEHITIDTDILCRLLQALQMTSTPHTPNHLQVELRTLQLREKALRALLNTQEANSKESSIETDELPSIASIRDGNFSKTEKISLPSSPTTTKVITKCTQSSDSSESQRSKLANRTSLEQSLQSKLETRSLQQQIDELNIYRKRYEELQLHTATGDNELLRYSAELTEQLKNKEIEFVKMRSSYSFMRDDFELTLAETQQKDIKHIQILADLKLEISSKDLEIKRLETELERLHSVHTYSKEEFETLLKSKSEIQAQLAYALECILSGKIAAELKIEDICAEYGIIEENLELDFITAEEYKQQKEYLNNAEQQQNELQRKIMQLEGLLEIAQEQIQLQQRLLNEITDNHIDLRHLVADLQSKTEEKYLMAKMQRELSSAKSKLMDIEVENVELNQKCLSLEAKLNAEQKHSNEIKNNFQTEKNRQNLKIKFLLKSLHALKEKYSKFTPLIFLTNFVFAYKRFLKREQSTSKIKLEIEFLTEKVQEIIDAKFQESLKTSDESTNFIKLIKAETQTKLLTENFAQLQCKYEALQQELIEQRIHFATESEHWHTIEMLFCNDMQAKISMEKQLQEKGINTDAPVPKERKLLIGKSMHIELIDKCLSPITSPVEIKYANVDTQTTSVEDKPLHSDSLIPNEQKLLVEVMTQTIAQRMESQCIQTLPSSDESGKIITIDVQTNNAEKETISKLQEAYTNAKKRIEELQELLKETKSQIKANDKSNEEPSKESGGIIEKTIMSFNSLLMDKDKSITKYQDLLQNERDHNNAFASKLRDEVNGLKNTVTNLNFNIKAKDMEILELKTKLESLSKRRNSNEKLDLATTGADETGDNSLNELTDEKIEEMFEHDVVSAAHGKENDNVVTTVVNKQADSKQDSLFNQIRGLEEKVKYAESIVKIKEDEISLLKEKLKLFQEREKSLETSQNPEIERLRLLIEEKDKHITDLMDTLKNFHDDQQNFIKDSSSYSENQITKLSTDLMRTEATNKIYQTQVEALRRQVTSLTQREKQARELNQSLRNQLIKRPVVSIKTELNTRVKTEHMQKRIQQLDLELEEARAQIQRQQILIETKRAKSASEVGLWEKQKRWQQNAEKFKAKLEETESTLEKTRTLLQSARNTITRLEKDKQSLEIKLGRATHGTSAPSSCTKCCRTTSCPNSNRPRAAMSGGKYTPSESPETYTGASSEYSSPSHSVYDGGSGGGNGVGGGGGGSCNNGRTQALRPVHHSSLIEALKARIEMQQRKILAMELEGKGKNALTSEMEKLQEKLSAIEAQNIRLEAKNLQLQLDNDLLRQNDVNDRMQKRIKHLEDYIIALKEELAQTEARRVVCKCSGIKMIHQQSHSADQTILSLRNLVEKLRAENKYLKDGRRSTDSRSSLEAMPTDINRLQQMYAESLDKIAALQIELNIKTKCTNSLSHGKISSEHQASNEELKYIKEQLLKKTQLLQKAKVLLTRAAAKEKILKEQLTLWKRKCSELQNVPVIDEISE